MRHSGVLGSSQITGADQDEINCFLSLVGSGGGGVSANVPYCVCRKEEFPLTKKLRLTPSHVKRGRIMSLQRILAQAITPSSERHKLLPNIQSVLATQCLSFWHLCVGLVIHGHSNEADRRTAQKTPKLDVHKQSCHDYPTRGKVDNNKPFLQPRRSDSGGGQRWSTSGQRWCLQGMLLLQWGASSQ